ncbi:glycosyltransferase family 39 protein [Streptomyces sp. 7N604]|uniref:glycosyltransferase family 39 protein n=1 Tax=Streptomyces sp. 7N604 TaxID=3457415 RepID=UPI003FD0495E
MKLTFELWDGGLVMLRLPSVAAAAAATAGVTALGWRLVNRRTGICAGYIFCVLPIVQRYSQEGRSYALVAACVIWATWFFVRLIDGAGSVLWYSVLLTTACVLHEFAVLAGLAHGVSVAMLPQRRALLARWVRGAGLPLLAVMPIVCISVGQDAQVSWISLTASALSGYLLLSVLSLVSWGVVCRIAGAPRPGLLGIVLLPLVLLPGGTLLGVSLVKPLYVDRYVLYTMAGVSILVAAAAVGAAGIAKWRLLVAVGAVVGLVVAPVTAVQLRTPASRSDDVVALGAAVADAGNRGDGVLFLPSSRRVWVPAPVLTREGLVDVALARSPRSSNSLYGTELSPAATVERVDRMKRLVVVSEPGRSKIEWRRQDQVKQAALRSFAVCSTQKVGKARVTVYGRSGQC